MEAALIAQLLAQFGPSAVALIDKLIVLVQNKATLTAQEWASLRETVLTPMASLQHVASSLGLSMDDPKIVALAALMPAAA